MQIPENDLAIHYNKIFHTLQLNNAVILGCDFIPRELYTGKIFIAKRKRSF